MRLAYIPMYSSPHNIATCSTYNHVKMVARSIVEEREDAFLYITVPEGADDMDRVRKELGHPRIQLIEVPAFKNQHKDLVYLPDTIISKFAEMGGELYVDAVLTDKATVIPYLKEALHTWGTNGTGGIKVVLVDRFFLRTTEHAYMRDSFYKSQLFGEAAADMIAWSSKNVLDDAMRTAKDFLSFAEIKRFRDKSHFLYSALSFDRLDPFIQERDPAAEQRVVNYAYAMSSGYKWEDNLEVFDYLFARGNRDVKVLVTTSSKGAGLIPERYKNYMEVHTGLPQEEFWKTISQAHAFIHLPHYVQLSQSVMEQQYLGLVGVFPNRPWAKDMTYPGYPYIGKDTAELNGMLRYVLDNYFSAEVQEVIEKQREFLRERFDGKKLALELFNRTKGLVGEGFPGSQGGLVNDMKELFADVAADELITYEQWADTIKEKTRMGYDVRDMPAVLHGVCKNRFYKAMLSAGFKDTYQTPQPGFVRVGE